MVNFRERVLSFIKKVPYGRVVSYGQVAAACGNPRAPRQVGWILHGLDVSVDGVYYKKSQARIHSARGTPRKGRSPDSVGTGRKGKPSLGFSSEFIPWWRVVNNHGYLSIKGNWENTKEIQTVLLRKEGVRVGEDFTLDIEKYRFRS